VVPQALLSELHAIFAVEGEAMLLFFVFSGPLALVYPTLLWLAPREVHWTRPEPE
jgi:hypothetical protein